MPHPDPTPIPEEHPPITLRGWVLEDGIRRTRQVPSEDRHKRDVEMLAVDGSEFSVSIYTVYDARNGRTWKHLP